MKFSTQPLGSFRIAIETLDASRWCAAGESAFFQCFGIVAPEKERVEDAAVRESSRVGADAPMELFRLRAELGHAGKHGDPPRRGVLGEGLEGSFRGSRRRIVGIVDDPCAARELDLLIPAVG